MDSVSAFVNGKGADRVHAIVNDLSRVRWSKSNESNLVGSRKLGRRSQFTWPRSGLAGLRDRIAVRYNNRGYLAVYTCTSHISLRPEYELL